MDTRIARQKVPKSALPQSLRVKLGFDKKRPLAKQSRSRYSEDTNPYAPGANVLQPRSSADGKYKAGCQKKFFLRRGSGSSFSSLAARKKKNKQGRGPQRRSHENKTNKTTRQSSNHVRLSKRPVKHHRRVSEQCKMSLNQIEDRLQKMTIGYPQMMNLLFSHLKQRIFLHCLDKTFPLHTIQNLNN